MALIRPKDEPAITAPRPGDKLILDSAPGVTSILATDFYLAMPAVPQAQKKLTGTGPYAAQPADQILIVAPAVPAPYTVTVDWSTRAGRPLRVVDGNHNASVNNISVTPGA